MRSASTEMEQKLPLGCVRLFEDEVEGTFLSMGIRKILVSLLSSVERR